MVSKKEKEGENKFQMRFEMRGRVHEAEEWELCTLINSRKDCYEHMNKEKNVCFSSLS